MARARITIPTPRQTARWLVGVPVSTAQWVRRRRHFERHETEHAGAMPAPAVTHEGVGPGYHRVYSIRIEGAQLGPEEIIARVGADPNLASPVHVARFVKERGAPERLEVGDEFDIELAGPWNGPVCVLAVRPTSFRLRTRAGHAETGEIEFRCSTLDDGALEFEIESWARSSDQFVGFTYDRLGLGREIQLNMWGHFLEGVAEVAGGSIRGGIRVDTDRYAAGVFEAST